MESQLLLSPGFTPNYADSAVRLTEGKAAIKE